uniref:Protein kinase domain-containing protein n=1 Tax=Anopheles maculatus TaxID=74869 RepID=A0A182SD25_9DIPT
IRAAEYLTTLLKEKPPARPKDGPGAPIDVTLSDDYQTESLLNGISYPSSTILLNNVESVTIDNNRDYYDKMCPMKRFEIKEKSSSIADGELLVFSSSNNNTHSAPDAADVLNPVLMERYPDQHPGPSSPRKSTFKPHNTPIPEGPISGDRLPMFSALGITADANQPAKVKLESSKLQNNRNYDHIANEVVDQYTPNLSIFGRAESVKEENKAPQELPEDIPALSALLGHAVDAHRSQINSNSANNTHNSVPMLSMLGSDSSTTESSESEFSSSAVISSSGESVSDMIKFSSLAIAVTDYTYDLLRNVTDNFNPALFTNGNLQTPDGRSIGAGGFGTVFLALNLSSTIPVAAVKRLDPDKYKFREKFQLERDILSKHCHGNVVSLLGSSSDGPYLCLVYEYLKDGNLETALSLVRRGQRQMEHKIRLKYLKDVANAIEFLHEKAKIIHRDVKSANILLDGSVAKLCDFGLIKLTSSRTTTSIIGTNAYMAPEAVRGDVSPALDIFAFGIVIAETVTGEPVLAEKESRSEIDLAGYICRQRAEGRDLGSLVDRRAATGNDEVHWYEAGRKLLDIAIRCMGEKWSRPNSSSLAIAISEIRLVPT